MTIAAIVRKNHDDSAPYTPVADTEPGTIVKLSDGRAAIVAGNNKIKANETGTVLTNVIVEVDNDGIDAYADGVECEWDSSAGQIVPSADPSGDFVLGRVRGAVSSGTVKTLVALNAGAPLNLPS